MLINGVNNLCVKTLTTLDTLSILFTILSQSIQDELHQFVHNLIIKKKQQQNTTDMTKLPFLSLTMIWHNDLWL